MIENIDLIQYEKMKNILEKQKQAQINASRKYYLKKKDIIIQKSKEYNKKKQVNEPKERTPEQQKKAEYNKRFYDKKKAEINNKHNPLD